MSLASSFRNISVRSKVIGTFACTLIATFALGLFAVEKISDVNGHAKIVRDSYLPSMKIQTELAYTTTRFRQRQGVYLLFATDDGRTKEVDNLRSIQAEIVKAENAYLPLVDAGIEQKMVDRWTSEWQRYVSLQDQLFDIFRTKGQAAAFAFYIGPYKTLFDSFRTDFNADLDYNNDHAKAEADSGEATFESARFWILTALGLVAALGFAAGAALIYAVSGPLGRLTGAVTELAGGNLAVVVPESNRKDEVGKLAGAMTTFKDQLSAAEKARKENEAAAERTRAEQAAVIGAVGTGLDALTKGDLTHRITAEMTGAFVKLKDDFNTAVSRMQDAMKNVLTSTGGISTGANEISQAADDLSRRTEQQAASLEETAAALEEITATVKKTAANTKEASSSVTAAKSAAEEGGKVVETAIAAMGKIEQSSKQITDIIGVIDEIAFQTNLLALNAGVEAARAGDAGKGFAVVASEVRALAQRSSEAAKEIKTLIKASGEHVGAGVKFVDESGKALKRIVEQVVGINALVTEMSHATEQQSTGIEQVNVAVSQMDQVTQQNAAMVEESTAASRNLASETGELVRLVSFFNVGTVQQAAAKKPAAQTLPSPAGKPVLRTVSRARTGTSAHGGRAAATALAIRPDAQAEEEDWKEF